AGMVNTTVFGNWRTVTSTALVASMPRSHIRNKTLANSSVPKNTPAINASPITSNCKVSYKVERSRIVSIQSVLSAEPLHERREFLSQLDRFRAECDLMRRRGLQNSSLCIDDSGRTCGGAECHHP